MPINSRSCGQLVQFRPWIRLYCVIAVDTLPPCRRSVFAKPPSCSASVTTPCDAGSTTGRCPRHLDASGRKAIDGAALAAFARANASGAPKDPLSVASSARNRFAGLVTKVVTDKVMAQVEMQCGPFTVVSLMSVDAVRELKLEPGSIAVAVVKATTVIVETPGGQS